jgi:hypothetical protein
MNSTMNPEDLRDFFMSNISQTLGQIWTETLDNILKLQNSDEASYQRMFKNLCDLNLKLANLTLDWVNSWTVHKGLMPADEIISRTTKITATLMDFVADFNKNRPYGQ